MEAKTLGIIAIGVAVVVVVLYVWDRRIKHQPIDLVDGGKLAVGAASIVGGVVYAVSGEGLPEITNTVSDMTQEMFVGKPEF